MSRSLLVLMLMVSGWMQSNDKSWDKLRDRKVQTQLTQIAYHAIVATVQGKQFNPKNFASHFTAVVVSESGLKDAVELSVPIKPRGVEVVQTKSGVTDTTATATFHLPDDAIRR